jgi:hypothetical protein
MSDCPKPGEPYEPYELKELFDLGEPHEPGVAFFYTEVAEKPR